MNSIDEAKKLLNASGIFFDADDFDEDEEDFNRYLINMNDTWAWACSYMEEVKEDELPELARLYSLYGWCGVLYWVSQKNEGMESEFHDNNRFIDFVKHEEKLIKDVPDCTKRAYKKIKYKLG